MDLPFRPKALAGPTVLSRRSSIIHVCSDAAAFFVAALFTGSGVGRYAGEGVVSASVLALWCIVVFHLLGLYKRSYSVFARDEIYFTVVGIALAYVPLILVGALHRFGLFLPHVLMTMALSILACSTVRVVLFERVRAPHQEAQGGQIFLAAVHPFTTLAKRIIDIVLGMLALLVFLPFMLLAGSALYLESSCPVFFRQERVGKDGRSFQIIKFRTMRPNAGAHWARPGDDRITPLGSMLRRLSIDEMPQIINVLRGEMSIVGPRPEWRPFAEEFAATLPYYNDRHRVKPGITGWAQLYMNRNLTPADAPMVLLHDLFYVTNCSAYLDLAIIVKTGAEFLFHQAV
jgi:lipopolysaccharide/colanic/teichoic acid biosynthesis glycosyltransferase